VPIIGRTLGDAARTFADAINRLLATTLTETRLVVVGPRDGPRVEVAFREEGGQPEWARLYTAFGAVRLFIGQNCEGIPVAEGRQLITVKYKYMITLDERADAPLLRWEYERTPRRGGLYCRHHLQGPVTLDMGRAGAVSLNELHLPTGYVPIEDIIRFCIVDLGVEALSDNWDRLLRESYTRFRREYVGLTD
jgi:hypothetical protein